ncbi:hypothetical protein [Bifidobacterium moukalabense]|uniref:hypothetical protein n=1 Tax=Bifidobacterium moukalabense TaxID=1333651 RepID=UPI0010F4D4A9|nr:hypothetical protein [Bifidobacterium moukalabense]
MKAEKVIKSAQEQAIAAWVGLINQIRINDLIENLNQQDQNLDSALESMNWALKKIEDLVVTNRGGSKGVHGFIAEVAECGLENAQNLVRGDKPVMKWVNDNGPADLLRDGVEIQVKFVNAGGKFSLEAVAAHLEKYPDFLDKDGVYQIPKDHLEAVRALYEIPKEEATQLVSSDGGPSYSTWKTIHEFFDTNGIKIDDLEASKFKYPDVQKNAIADKMAEEKNKLADESNQIKKNIYEEHKPTPQEGAKAAAMGAVFEAGTAFALSVKRHLGNGKRIGDLTQDDWTEIAKDSGMGLVKGGVRGGAMYRLNNYMATPASVASALVTASFGVADCVYRFRNGELTEVEFIENSEIACLDASVSAFSSFVGQVLIPVPVLGAFVGNAVGTTVYELGKDFYSKQEAELLERYTQEVRILDAELDDEYATCMSSLRENMVIYIDLLGKAFSPDAAMAFAGSIELAASLNVPNSEILHTQEEIDDFFLN